MGLNIISDQFSMSLIDALAPKLPQNTNYPSLQIGAPSEACPQGKSMNPSKRRQMLFNGIIFRDQTLLQSLGISESVAKLQDQKAKHKDTFNNLYASMGIKLAMDRSDSKLIKVILAEHNIESRQVEVRFAFIEKNVPYCDYQFVKVNFLCEGSLKTIKILLCHSSFDGLVKLLSQKSIRFYINPEVNQQTSLCPSLLSLQNLCSLSPQLDIAQFQGDKIDYTVLCTFNGSEGCLAIFTTSRVIVFQGYTFIKVIDQGHFKQGQYWIESQQDWISFQSKDHLLVFKQKVEEVVAKAAQIRSRLSTIKKCLPQQKQLLGFSLEQTQRKLSNGVCLTQLKTTFESQCQRRCKSDLIQNRHHVQIIAEQCQLSKRLFGQDDMVDEKEQQRPNTQQIVPQSKFDQLKIDQENIEDSSLVNEQQSSEMIEELDSSSMIDHQDYQQHCGDASQEMEIRCKTLQKCSYITNYSQFASNHFTSQVFASQKFEVEQATIRTTFDQSIKNDHSKENCQNFINQAPKTAKKSSIECGQPEVQAQHVFNRKESLLKLQQFYSSHDIQVFENPFVPEVHIDEEEQRAESRAAFNDISQVSANCLAALTFDYKMRLYLRNSADEYERKQLNSVDILQPARVFSTRIVNSLLFSKDNSDNLHLYSLQGMNEQQINIFPMQAHQIKDAISLNSNQFIALTANSITLIDRRQHNQQRRIYFKTNQKFEKIAMKQTIAAVGRSDGKVKLYDLRNLKPKSLNNFDLCGTKKDKTGGRGINTFERIRILQNCNIFCEYNSSSFVINGQNNPGSNIFTSSLKNSERSFILQQQIHPKIINSIDSYHADYDDRLKFTIDNRGQSVVALYKNFSFQFKASQQRLQSWRKIQSANSRRHFYLNFNEHSERSQLISGFYRENKECFTVSAY